MLASSGWLAEASQMSWSGDADMKSDVEVGSSLDEVGVVFNGLHM